MKMYKKKVLAMLKEGTTSFWVDSTRVLEVLAILKKRGGGGIKCFTLSWRGGGGAKSFGLAILPIL